MNSKPFISVCIPTWGIKGSGIDYLDYSLNILAQQTFKDFDVVISDHSEDFEIADYIKLWKDYLNITYTRYEKGRGSISPNLNNAIRNCTGEYIKILFQDDFLYDENSLEIIATHLKSKSPNWLLTASVHTTDMVTMYDILVPRYHAKIHEGINTISCPTVLTLKNTEDKLYFDENLKWLMDVEYYKRLYIKYGSPYIVSDICAVNRQADVRATTLLSKEEKEQEVRTVTAKYLNCNKINLKNVTVVSVAGIRAVEALKAIKYSCQGIDFASVKLITPENIVDDSVEVIKCEPLNYEQYNHFIVYKLHEYIDTDYALIIQDDGFVINPDKWDDSFLNYDYVGAPWPLPQDSISFKDAQGNLQRVGNGGFTLRSKKLLSLASELKLEWKPYYGHYNEDGFFCCHNRHIYEEHGCKFADIHTAARFSHEISIPETQGIIPFGFHGKNHPYYKQTINTI